MRFVLTSTQTVDKFKQLAKKLKRNRGIPHAEALDKVAQQHNYNHWGHVAWCAKETLRLERGLPDACADAVKSAQAGTNEAHVLENEGVRPLFLFSENGDAWLLDPFDRKGLCLCWRGEPQPYVLKQSGRAMEIGWDAQYTTTEDSQFSVESNNPKVGTRVIEGYPIRFIEELETRKFSPELRQIFFGEGAEEITDELIEELVASGTPRERIEEARAQGMTYSRPRKTFIGPVMTDEDFIEGNDARYAIGKDAFIEATGGFRVGQSMAEFEANEREKYALLAKMARGKATPADIARLDHLRGVDEEDLW